MPNSPGATVEKYFRFFFPHFFCCTISLENYTREPPITQEREINTSYKRSRDVEVRDTSAACEQVGNLAVSFQTHEYCGFR